MRLGTMDTAICFVFLQAILAILQAPGARGGGRLYLGFTAYTPLPLTQHGGRGQEGGDGSCSLPCHLLFQVSVTGLDGSHSPAQQSAWSAAPLTSGQSPLLLLSPHGDHLTNPMAFHFDHWPDCVGVEVSIFDVIKPRGEEEEREGRGQEGGGGMRLVDRMVLHMASSPPSAFFAQTVVTGRRLPQPSNLTVVVRYECDLTSSPTPCPSPSTASMTSDTNVIRGCLTPSALTSTVILPTDSVLSTPWSESTSLMTSYGAEMTSYAVMTSHTTAQADTSLQQESSALLTPSATAVTDPGSASPSPVISTHTFSAADFPSSSPQPSSAVTLSPTPSSSHADVTPGPPMTSTKEKSVTDYWPEILGSVLGAVVVVALVGFLLYRRRRKALLSHQEVYRVTPRLVTTLQDNGTAGRSDIPVQMADT